MKPDGAFKVILEVIVGIVILGIFVNSLSNKIDIPPIIDVIGISLGALILVLTALDTWKKRAIAGLAILLASSVVVYITYQISSTKPHAIAVSVHSTATATVSSSAATAPLPSATTSPSGSSSTNTPISPSTLYPPSGWNIAFFDPLSMASHWQNGSDSSGNSCHFKNNAYHIIVSSQKGGIFFCTPPSETFSDFAAEVSMEVIHGDCGGIWFRGNGPSYLYQLCQDESYALILYKSPGPQILVSGTSKAIHAGLKQSNLIAVVANGSRIDLYANQQRIESYNDTILSQGQLNLNATGSSPTEVAYTNLTVWTP